MPVGVLTTLNSCATMPEYILFHLFTRITQRGNHYDIAIPVTAFLGGSYKALLTHGLRADEWRGIHRLAYVG